MTNLWNNFYGAYFILTIQVRQENGTQYYYNTKSCPHSSKWTKTFSLIFVPFIICSFLLSSWWKLKSLLFFVVIYNNFCNLASYTKAHIIQKCVWRQNGRESCIKKMVGHKKAQKHSWVHQDENFMQNDWWCLSPTRTLHAEALYA